MLTVAICTHNPRHDHLSRTLAALEAQDLPQALWEIVVIDNASVPPVADTFDLSWHPLARVIVEDNLGLTNARLRAIAESSSELILFIDDDNILTPEYLSTLLDLANQHPALGVIGAGRILPEYETEPTAELQPYLHMLTLRELEAPCWSNIPTDTIRPYGAGMAVRRPVLEAYTERTTTDPLLRSLGRRGEQLLSAEDEEFNWIACEMGLGKGIFPALELTHLIDQKRLTKDYLLELCTGHLASQTVLLSAHGQPAPEVYIPSWSFLATRFLKEKVNIYKKFHNFNKDMAQRMAYLDSDKTERAFQTAQVDGIAKGRELLTELRQSADVKDALSQDSPLSKHHPPLPRQRELSS